MTYETVTCETKDQVMLITLNRPEKLNAYNRQMSADFLAALNEAEEDDHVKAVVVTGAGRAFCAGADLESGSAAFEEIYPDGIEEEELDGGFIEKLYNLNKPVIAAINGHAVGVGITLTLPMDIRICADNAKIGFIFTRRGILPEAGSGWFLPKLVGISKALEWIYTGDMITPQEALESGLVSKVVPPEEVLPAALALAGRIAANTSAPAVALSRQLCWKMLGADGPMHSHLIETKGNLWAARQADAVEGINSFLEKRSARFTMSSSELPEFYPWWEQAKIKLKQ